MGPRTTSAATYKVSIPTYKTAVGGGAQIGQRTQSRGGLPIRPMGHKPSSPPEQNPKGKCPGTPKSSGQGKKIKKRKREETHLDWGGGEDDPPNHLVVGHCA